MWFFSISLKFVDIKRQISFFTFFMVVIGNILLYICFVNIIRSIVNNMYCYIIVNIVCMTTIFCFFSLYSLLFRQWYCNDTNVSPCSFLVMGSWAIIGSWKLGSNNCCNIIAEIIFFSLLLWSHHFSLISPIFSHNFSNTIVEIRLSPHIAKKLWTVRIS